VRFGLEKVKVILATLTLSKRFVFTLQFCEYQKSETIMHKERELETNKKSGERYNRLILAANLKTT
jgi:hypothetical protein